MLVGCVGCVVWSGGGVVLLLCCFVVCGKKVDGQGVCMA